MVRRVRDNAWVYTKDWGGGVDGGLRLPGKGQPHCAMTRSR
jgi:hypothetical protein